MFLRDHVLFELISFGGRSNIIKNKRMSHEDDAEPFTGIHVSVKDQRLYVYIQALSLLLHFYMVSKDSRERSRHD